MRPWWVNVILMLLHTALDGTWVHSLFVGPAHLPGQTEGRSFDPDELSDSDEDDQDVFIAPAPPDYQDVVG